MAPRTPPPIATTSGARLHPLQVEGGREELGVEIRLEIEIRRKIEPPEPRSRCRSRGRGLNLSGKRVARV